MTSSDVELAAAFLELAPDRAAAVLERLPASEVGPVLALMPPHTAAGALQRMLPPNVAGVFLHMTGEHVAALAKRIPASLLVAAMRTVNVDRRTAWLGQLPARTQAACTLLLDYSVHTVGAWMNPTVTPLPSGITVGEALARLAEAGAEADPIPVLERDRRLAGQVSITALVSAAADLPLATVCREAPATVPGHASLEEAWTHGGWRGGDVLAVVNRDRQFIGLLRHRDLRFALESLVARREEVEAPATDLVGCLACAYGDTLKATLDVWSGPPEATQGR